MKRHSVATKQRVTGRKAARLLPLNSQAWRVLRLQVLRESGFRCAICSKLANEVDHINGDACNNARANLQALCKSCHARKSKETNK